MLSVWPILQIVRPKCNALVPSERRNMTITALKAIAIASSSSKNRLSEF